MQELGIYSIFDEKGERFDTPFCALSDLNAERHFQMMIQKNGSLVSTFKNDFSLHKVGSFDVISGEITRLEEHIIDGKSIQVREEVNQNAVNHGS
jgi:hypothetical protein